MHLLLPPTPSGHAKPGLKRAFAAQGPPFSHRRTLLALPHAPSLPTAQTLSPAVFIYHTILKPLVAATSPHLAHQLGLLSALPPSLSSTIAAIASVIVTATATASPAIAQTFLDPIAV
ncbi:hypothetical protein R3P38DRAFT_3236551 [Favolaschia claudopus]|uniref:Uncharacterized protein n=1 Tax=Favolaschia claudopus TaxID=2862362 RepID=A0AAV9ZDC8_9AGAR